MTNLFNLSNDILDKFKVIYEDLAVELSEDVLDPSSYVVGMADIVKEEADKYHDTLILLLTEMEVSEMAIAQTISKLSDRKKRIQRRIELIRDILKSLLNVTGLDRIQSDFGTTFKMKSTKYISFKDITEEEFFEKYPQYTKVQKTLMKKQLLEDINDGVVVDGIELHDRDSIGIRR